MNFIKSIVSVPLVLAFAAMTTAEPAAPPELPPAAQPAGPGVTAPTTQPVTTIGVAPATQPAAVANIAGPAKLLLLPFNGVDPADRRDWIGRGVLASLQADLSRLPGILPVTLDATRPENAPPPLGYDTETASKIAQAVGARYAIYGTYQTSDPELRLAAVILDVQTGQPVGGLKATGTLRDIFGMEDSLGNQAKRLLPQPAVTTQAPPAPPAPAPAPANWNNGPVRNPFPGVTFDDDAAKQSLDRLRYRDDYYPPLFPYSGFGFAPVWGYGFGYGISYHPTRPVTPKPLPAPRPSPPVGIIVRGRVENDRSPFRGGASLDFGTTVSHGGRLSTFGASGSFGGTMNGVYRGGAANGNYIAATPQNGNYIHPTPQSGNYIRPTPQSGNYIHPTR